MPQSVKSLIALFSKPNIGPTDIFVNVNDLIEETGKIEQVGDVKWSEIVFLEARDPAPTGWIPSDFVDHDFKRVVDPEIDSAIFAENALYAASSMLANLHFLLAWAFFESEIKNLVREIAGIERIGPYQFTPEIWDAHRNVEEFGIDFEKSRIYEHEYQCDIAALIIRRTVEAFKVANAGAAPKATELLLAIYIGVPAVKIALESDRQLSIVQSIDSSIEGQEDAETKRNKTLALYQDVLTNGDPANPCTTDETLQIIGNRLNAALDATRILMEEIDPDLLPSSDADLNLDEGIVVMAHGGAPVANVRGFLVAKLQEALAAAGSPPLKMDTVFGPDTKKALNNWQDANGEKQSGKLTDEVWQKLTGVSPPTPYEKCAQLTASFEGHFFADVITGNSDAAILTWGFLGFTFRFGHVQEIILRADAKNQQWLEESFGSEKAAALRDILTKELNPHQLDWAKANMLIGDTVRSDWEAAFKHFGSIAGVQEIQIEYGKTLWDQAQRIVQPLKLCELISHAMCFDIAVKDGPNALKNSIAGLEPNGDELGLRRKISERGNNQPRRKVFVSGDGKVNSMNYRLEYWGIQSFEEDEENLHTDDKDPNPTYDQDFEAYLIASVPEIEGLFEPREFLVRGGNAGPGENPMPPPRKLWKNVPSLARVLVRIRSEIGKPIQLCSVYRGPDYNKKVGGVKNSQHLFFKAADFKVVGPNPGNSTDWANAVKRLRDVGVFKGGVGKYRTFVHVDTRGDNKNWFG
ncbi:D-Ala-D-Ala carboxypeptidase family metallohydrolase [Hoeflea alexandrii]|uniref:D-Ala-D-Ala carboxypeptidase family metallohydrolase n=1 Tax=Hoeflea alexandrii TaxID=288436 RepID=UPI0022B06884|nr:D-Ala-D-Ala carboxypeptidase family metallohydrolase [Hoeflea alexandrii]MCZ4289946.1 D-Ala-D-Ala carboxypeptidase family metallohydrolase [Hoeflea alexandrii]